MKSPCAIAVVAVLRFKCPLAAAERDFDAAFASSEGSPAASGRHALGARSNVPGQRPVAMSHPACSCLPISAGFSPSGTWRRFGRWGGRRRLASVELVEALVAIEGRPWAESKAGKPITANGLARMLAPFRIVPDTIRVGDRTPKGYQRAHFDDAFSRYLRPEGI